MPTIEVGRICVKLNGRETGQKCVIVDVIDKNFVLVTGPKKVSGVRRRRTNVKHLEPTEDSIDIKKGATDEDVARVIGKGKKAEAFKESVLPKQVLITAQ
jgi:large subunit ribosomal protein L14e